MMRRLLPVLLLLLITACGSSGDAGTAADTTAGPATPDIGGTADTDTAPTPCPTGHVPGADGVCMPVGIQGCAEMFIDPETGLCDPRPEDCPPGHIPIFSEGCVRVGVVDCHLDFIDPETGHCDPDPDGCAPHHIPVPTQGCVSLDPPGGCGDGTWGLVELLDGDVHVDIAYAGGNSDGSREGPFTIIEDATDVVQDGGRVVLAAGDYAEGVVVTKSFELVGRCSSMVTISGAKATFMGVDAVVRVNGDVDAVIRDVTLSGPGIGIFAYSQADLEVQRLALVENHHLGMLLRGGTSVDVTDVLIARTQPEVPPPGVATYGRGVSVYPGNNLTLTRSALVDNHDIGLYATGDGTSVNVSDVLIARTQPDADGMGGLGVYAARGAALTLTRSVLVDNRVVGLDLGDDGTSADVSNVLIARTQPDGDGNWGNGIEVVLGAALTITRGVLVGNHSMGLFAASEGTSVDVTDLLVARTEPEANGTSGRGVSVQDSASLTLNRGVLVDNHEVGLFVGGGYASVSNTMISATHLGPAGRLGDGLLAMGSVVIATGVVSRGNARAGFLYSDSGGEVTGCYATANAIGLATQTINLLAGPDIADDNVFEGNAQNVMTDGDLEIPDEAMAVPIFSDFD